MNAVAEEARAASLLARVSILRDSPVQRAATAISKRGQRRQRPLGHELQVLVGDEIREHRKVLVEVFPQALPGLELGARLLVAWLDEQDADQQTLLRGQRLQGDATLGPGAVVEVVPVRLGKVDGNGLVHPRVRVLEPNHLRVARVVVVHGSHHRVATGRALSSDDKRNRNRHPDPSLVVHHRRLARLVIVLVPGLVLVRSALRGLTRQDRAPGSRPLAFDALHAVRDSHGVGVLLLNLLQQRRDEPVALYDLRGVLLVRYRLLALGVLRRPVHAAVHRLAVRKDPVDASQSR